jgi:mono/diheme cytochrome c family protein
MMGPPGTMGPPAGFDVESGPHAAGKKVFVANGCFRCHNIGSIGAPPAPSPGFPPGPGGPGGPGRGGNRGPDLAKIGSNPEHTVDWLVEFIRKPQSKKAKARMPAFEGKISEPDLRALAEYLASLKE